MAYVVGAFQTAFRRGSGRSHADLASEAIGGALADAGMAADAIEAVWFGSAALHRYGSSTVGAAEVLQGPGGPIPGGVPVVQVHAACATGAYALYGAYTAVLSGQVDVALAIGVDRTDVADPVALLESAIVAGSAEFVAERVAGFAPVAGRPILLDIGAAEARHALEGWATLDELAQIVVDNRAAGALNPNAWLRKPTTREAVLGESEIVAPLRRSMCCALVDGAAAVIVVSDRGRPKGDRAVRIAGMAIGGGSWRGLGDPSSTVAVGDRAWARTGLDRSDVQVAEVHDANAYAQREAIRALGLGPEVAVNPSGGLLSKGHPLAATGLAQIVEITAQLRGEAGDRQVAEATVGVCHNAGGLIGFDHAATAVTVLSAR